MPPKIECPVNPNILPPTQTVDIFGLSFSLLCFMGLMKSAVKLDADSVDENLPHQPSIG